MAIKFADWEKIDRSNENERLFLIFRGEQRVLGEFCTVLSRTHKSWWCIGVDDFMIKVRHRDESKKCYLSIDKLLKDIEALLTYQQNPDDKTVDGRPGIERLKEVNDELRQLIKMLTPISKPKACLRRIIVCFYILRRKIRR